MDEQRQGSRSGVRRAVEALDLEPEADTTGHSSLAYEFGATVARDRQRQAERAARDLGRLAQRPRLSLLDRIRGRLPSGWAARRAAGLGALFRGLRWLAGPSPTARSGLGSGSVGTGIVAPPSD